MGWVIKVGRKGFERGANAGVTTFQTCIVTSTTCRTVAQVTVSPNAGRTTSGKAGSNPACQAEQVWQNVLSTLVGVT
jgi:hypothetical protein